MVHIGDMNVIDVMKFGTVGMKIQKIVTTRNVNPHIGIKRELDKNANTENKIKRIQKRIHSN